MGVSLSLASVLLVKYDIAQVEQEQGVSLEVS